MIFIHLQDLQKINLELPNVRTPVRLWAGPLYNIKAMKEQIFHVKAYNKKQLIKELDITNDYEFKKIVAPHKEKIGNRMGYYYTPKQVRIIFELVQAYKKSLALTKGMQ